jgi:hypothetical protein
VIQLGNDLSLWDSQFLSRGSFLFFFRFVVPTADAAHFFDEDVDVVFFALVSSANDRLETGGLFHVIV